MDTVRHRCIFSFSDVDIHHQVYRVSLPFNIRVLIKEKETLRNKAVSYKWRRS